MALGVGQDGGNRPVHVLADAKGNAAQVGGLHLRQADVDDRHAVPGGDFAHHLGLADAGRAPHHHGGVVAFGGAEEFAFEYGNELGGTHKQTETV